MLAAVSLLATSAFGQTVRAGNLIVTIEGGFTPHRLSAKTPGSITLSARSTIRTADGTHLPALDFLTIDWDKHTGVDIEGLPTCTVGKLSNTITSQAKRICRDAIIGSGQAGAEIAFPEQEPFFAKAPMVIFNGPPKNGHPVFIFHVYAHVPAPTTFITTAQISRATGLYGTTGLHQGPDDRRRPGLAELRRTLHPSEMDVQRQRAHLALRDVPVRAFLRARLADLQRRLQDGRQGRAQLLAGQ